MEMGGLQWFYWKQHFFLNGDFPLTFLIARGYGFCLVWQWVSVFSFFLMVCLLLCFSTLPRSWTHPTNVYIAIDAICLLSNFTHKILQNLELCTLFYGPLTMLPNVKQACNKHTEIDMTWIHNQIVWKNAKHSWVPFGVYVCLCYYFPRKCSFFAAFV